MHIEERFWRKVERTPGCWLWQGGRTSRAAGGGKYGSFHHPGGSLAHRYSWQLENGPIPDGMLVLHRCDTPLCVRPSHLFLGSQSENVRDSFAKGRQSRVGALNPRRKLTEEQVRAIRARPGTGHDAMRLGLEYGVSYRTIEYIWSRRLWRHLPD